MAAGTTGTMSSPQPIPQASHRGAPVSNTISNNLQGAVSPPSKRDLTSWWKKFSRKPDSDEDKGPHAPGIFGVPLSESIRYANVAISLTNDQGESFIYGYVPIVVAKCGVFLKERATDVEGIFRLNGSAKRIKDLQAAFNSPDRYGKGLDWAGYTVHDAANILRRYLNQLPEPIVPLEFYSRFREPLRAYQAKVGAQSDAGVMENDEHAKAVTSYQKLITELPALNRQLLLYILDLLAVFASKSDLNRMNAANLAAIFQPGIISHPQHDMAPQEYRLSQDVLIFLIENQDNFLIGMTGTAVDEKTQKDVESGAPSVRTPKTNTLGRSASNASAGADSLRKYGVRRNLSVSSHNSRDRGSPGVSTPATPSSPSALPGGSSGGGLTRSNTVPSKRSPAIGSSRFQRPSDASNAPSTPSTAAPETGQDLAPAQISEATVGEGFKPSTGDVRDIKNEQPPVGKATQDTTGQPAQIMTGQAAQTMTGQAIQLPVGQNEQSPITPTETVSRNPAHAPGDELPSQAAHDMNLAQETATPIQGAPTGPVEPASKERKISHLFPRSPLFGPSDGQMQQQRPQRKLQKRRLPGSANESAQSSQASLPAEDSANFPNQSFNDASDPNAFGNMTTTHTGSTVSEHFLDPKQTSPPSTRDNRSGSKGLMPPKSPTTSLHSRGSATETSDFDGLDDPANKDEKRKHRWRSSLARKGDDSPLMPPPPIGQLSGARTSNSSLGSNRPRQSFTTDSQANQHMGTDTSSIGHSPSVTATSITEFGDNKDHTNESEKRGFLSKLKAKMNQSKEDRRERDAEKERAKSPPRSSVDQNAARSSLSAVAHDHFSPRGRSFDKPREDSLPMVAEQPKAEVVSEQKFTSTPQQHPQPQQHQNQQQQEKPQHSAP